MTKKEDYENAKKVVEDYERDVLSSLIKDKTCCVCKTSKITPIRREGIDPMKQEQGMWAKGVVEKVGVGFGSVHDSKVFYIAICDGCISELEEKGLVESRKKIRDSFDNLTKS